MATTTKDHAMAALGALPEHLQYLTFMLDGGTFAVGILGIKEIIEYGELTTVPRMPDFVRGVINLRGAVVPVIDLGVRFGGAASAVTRRSCIVIIEIDDEDEDARQVVGIMVDAVNEVVEIPPSQVEPAPTFGASIRVDFIQGMGKVDDRFIIILEAKRVLSVTEMSLLASARNPQLAKAA